jgi:hypothetical protein
MDLKIINFHFSLEENRAYHYFSGQFTNYCHNSLIEHTIKYSIIQLRSQFTNSVFHIFNFAVKKVKNHLLARLMRCCLLFVRLTPCRCGTRASRGPAPAWAAAARMGLGGWLPSLLGQRRQDLRRDR